MFRSRSNAVRVGIAAPALVLALAACGGSSGGSAAASGSTAAPTTSSTAGTGRGFGGQDFTKIQQCLTAAGISIPTPSGGFPSGGTRPTGGFNGTPPSDGTRPSGAPDGGFGGGNSGMGQVLQSSAAQAALKACGITVPTGGPSAQSTAS